MFGKLNAVEIEEVLKRQLIGRIGCHANGVTYVLPMSYAYDGENIYIRGFEGMKLQMMRKNPFVCFEVDEMKDMGNWKSVIAWGDYEELKDTEQRNNALQKLIDRPLPFISSETAHLTPNWPFISSDLNSIDGVVCRIKLTEKTGRFETTIAASAFAS